MVLICFLVMLSLCGLSLGDTVQVSGVVPGDGTPATIPLGRYVTYALVYAPKLQPGQGWSVACTEGCGGQSTDLTLILATSINGDNVVTNESVSFEAAYHSQAVFSPCRPESLWTNYLNQTAWVLYIISVAGQSATFQVSVVDTPAPRSIDLSGNAQIALKISATSPGLYYFTTPDDISALYFFAQSSAGASVYFRITTSPCSGIVYAGSSSLFFEREVPLGKRTLYYLYLSPNHDTEVTLSLYSLPESPSCSVSCSAGGACYNGKCVCKNAYSGTTCDMYSCNGVDPTRLCACPISAVITQNTLVHDVPRYYSFKKPSPVNDDHGWYVKLVDSNFWGYYYVNQKGGAANPSYCPRDMPVLDVYRTDLDIDPVLTQVGIRACSRQQVMYKSISEFVVRVNVEAGQGNINSNASVVDIPPPKPKPVQTGIAIAGTVGDWDPLLMEYNVPAGVSRVALSYKFSSPDFASIYHTLELMQAPCDFVGSTSYDLQNINSGAVNIAVQGGNKVYLLLTSRYSPVPNPYTITIRTL